MAKTPEFPKPPVVAGRLPVIKVTTTEYTVFCEYLDCVGRIAFGVILDVYGTLIVVCERCDNQHDLGATPVRFEIVQ